MIWQLERRGYHLGSIETCVNTNRVNSAEVNADRLAADEQVQAWHAGHACLIKAACLDKLEQQQQNIAQSAALYLAVLDQIEPHLLMDRPPYSSQLDGFFESLGSSVNEGDDQEIETVLFDAIEQGESVAQDLWMKVSWLSFYQEDASLRFRFSFGMDHSEDVAADKHRQDYAAQLSDAVFPESQLITQNEKLTQILKRILNCEQVSFVERIVYFNSYQGGAYLHHDQERGHAGVVYAQLSGQTYWLALPKSALLAEIQGFVKSCQQQNKWPSQFEPRQRDELVVLANDTKRLNAELDSFANDNLIHLINETKAFVQQLIAAGHGHLIETGDVLLLPQEDQNTCCWHSVFNLGEESGQALSFAVRGS